MKDRPEAGWEHSRQHGDGPADEERQGGLKWLLTFVARGSDKARALFVALLVGLALVAGAAAYGGVVGDEDGVGAPASAQAQEEGAGGPEDSDALVGGTTGIEPEEAEDAYEEAEEQRGVAAEARRFFDALLEGNNPSVAIADLVLAGIGGEKLSDAFSGEADELAREESSGQNSSARRTDVANAGGGDEADEKPSGDLLAAAQGLYEEYVEPAPEAASGEEPAREVASVAPAVEEGSGEEAAPPSAQDAPTAMPVADDGVGASEQTEGETADYLATGDESGLLAAVEDDVAEKTAGGGAGVSPAGPAPELASAPPPEAAPELASGPAPEPAPESAPELVVAPASQPGFDSEPGPAAEPSGGPAPEPAAQDPVSPPPSSGGGAAPGDEGEGPIPVGAPPSSGGETDPDEGGGESPVEPPQNSGGDKPVDGGGGQPTPLPDPGESDPPTSSPGSGDPGNGDPGDGDPGNGDPSEGTPVDPEPEPEPSPAPTPEKPEPDPAPENPAPEDPKPEPENPVLDPTPEDPKPEPTPEEPEPTPDPKPEPTPGPAPEDPAPEPTPDEPEVTPDEPEPTPAPPADGSPGEQPQPKPGDEPSPGDEQPEDQQPDAALTRPEPAPDVPSEPTPTTSTGPEPPADSPVKGASAQEPVPEKEAAPQEAPVPDEEAPAPQQKTGSTQDKPRSSGGTDATEASGPAGGVQSLRSDPTDAPEAQKTADGPLDAVSSQGATEAPEAPDPLADSTRTRNPENVVGDAVENGGSAPDAATGGAVGEAPHVDETTFMIVSRGDDWHDVSQLEPGKEPRVLAEGAKSIEEAKGVAENNGAGGPLLTPVEALSDAPSPAIEPSPPVVEDGPIAEAPSGFVAQGPETLGEAVGETADFLGGAAGPAAKIGTALPASGSQYEGADVPATATDPAYGVDPFGPSPVGTEALGADDLTGGLTAQEDLPAASSQYAAPDFSAAPLEASPEDWSEADGAAQPSYEADPQVTNGPAPGEPVQEAAAPEAREASANDETAGFWPEPVGQAPFSDGSYDDDVDGGDAFIGQYGDAGEAQEDVGSAGTAFDDGAWSAPATDAYPTEGSALGAADGGRDDEETGQDALGSQGEDPFDPSYGSGVADLGAGTAVGEYEEPLAQEPAYDPFAGGAVDGTAPASTGEAGFDAGEVTDPVQQETPSFDDGSDDWYSEPDEAFVPAETSGFADDTSGTDGAYYDDSGDPYVEPASGSSGGGFEEPSSALAVEPADGGSSGGSSGGDGSSGGSSGGSSDGGSSGPSSSGGPSGGSGGDSSGSSGGGSGAGGKGGDD